MGGVVARRRQVDPAALRRDRVAMRPGWRTVHAQGGG